MFSARPLANEGREWGQKISWYLNLSAVLPSGSEHLGCQKTNDGSGTRVYVIHLALVLMWRWHTSESYKHLLTNICNVFLHLLSPDALEKSCTNAGLNIGLESKASTSSRQWAMLQSAWWATKEWFYLCMLDLAVSSPNGSIWLNDFREIGAKLAKQLGESTKMLGAAAAKGGSTGKNRYKRLGSWLSLIKSYQYWVFWYRKCWKAPSWSN